MNLFEKIISQPNALAKYKGKACIHPEPYQGNSEVVRWLKSLNNGCTVFYACSKAISDMIEEDGYDIDYDLAVWIENSVMPFCRDNTEWEKCCRYGIEYDKKVPKRLMRKGEKCNYSFEMGCEGDECHCEPFGDGGWSYDIADESDFNLE